MAFQPCPGSTNVCLAGHSRYHCYNEVCSHLAWWQRWHKVGTMHPTLALLAQRWPNLIYKYNGLIITGIRYVFSQHNTLLNCILKILLMLLQVNSLHPVVVNCILSYVLSTGHCRYCVSGGVLTTVVGNCVPGGVLFTVVVNCVLCGVLSTVELIASSAVFFSIAFQL